METVSTGPPTAFAGPSMKSSEGAPQSIHTMQQHPNFGDPPSLGLGQLTPLYAFCWLFGAHGGDWWGITSRHSQTSRLINLRRMM